MPKPRLGILALRNSGFVTRTNLNHESTERIKNRDVITGCKN
jgi:hypothetical protein